MLRRLTLLTLILLALLLPFELQRPWLDLGLLVLTNVELLLWLALALSAVLWWRSGRPRPRLPRAWLVAGLLFLGALFLSALLAPEFRGNALKASLRTASGMALALAVAVAPELGRTSGQRSLVFWLAAAMVAGGLAAAALGLAEVLYGSDFVWLTALRPAPTVAGRFLRLSGPFDYANQAAMYIEATLPLLLALLWLAARAKRRRATLIGMLAFLFYVEAAIYTFSRASFVSIVVAQAATAVLLSPQLSFRRGRERWQLVAHQWRQRLPTLQSLFAGSALLVLLLIGVNGLANPVFRLRFQSEGDNDWYLARYDVPTSLELNAGAEQTVTVTVTNEGSFTWRSAGSRPIHLAARWVQPESGRELARRPRWPLPQAVSPGESLTMEVMLQAPATAGEYRLVWDMVQEQVVWFGAKTGREANSIVTVKGDTTVSNGAAAPEASEENFEATWAYEAPIPGRLALWRTAWLFFRQRPLLGIGLDNFRLRYGEPLGYEVWNRSIHTNNWYIETAVAVGLLGAVPFFLLLSLLTLDIMHVLRRRANIWGAAVAAGLLAYLLHGLLDYFLLFNATGLLFWILLGLWLRLTKAKENYGKEQRLSPGDEGAVRR